MARKPTGARSTGKRSTNLIAWADLTEEEKIAFETAFQSDKARFARSRATIEHTDHKDVYAVSLLSSWTQCIADRAKSKKDNLRLYREAESQFKPEVARLVSEIQKMGDNMETMLFDRIMQQVRMYIVLGSWDKLAWFAGYCEKHAPHGLSQGGPMERLPNFPGGKEVLAPKPNARLLKEVMLSEFLVLSGMAPKALHFPTYSIPPRRKGARSILQKPDAPPGRMLPECVPSHLPTKAHLRERAQARMYALGKKDNDRSFTKYLGVLGLSGLPQADKSWHPG